MDNVISHATPLFKRRGVASWKSIGGNIGVDTAECDLNVVDTHS